MKKMFLASVVLLACSIGFFLGGICLSKPHGICQNTQMAQPMKKIGNEDSNKKGEKKARPEKPKFSKEKLDSLLQITEEQRAKLDDRKKGQDSLFKALKKEHREAEKELRHALEADTLNDDSISIAKEKLNAVQKKELELRIEGAKFLSEVLSIEQRNQMKKFHEKAKKHAMKKKRAHDKKFRKGPPEHRKEKREKKEKHKAKAAE